jgi:putative spermidine/putrescine transport system ATP-binding protein
VTTDSGASAIRFVDVSKRFGDVVAVNNVSLDVAPGEFFSMLGPSGSGKTTMLRMVAGFELPTSGRIELDGHDVTNLPPFQRDVNTVFQDYALFPHMTVAKNVAYGLVVKKTPKTEIASRVAEALEAVRLPEYGNRKPHQLSGGQRQRVALARALVNRPRVLLLDEPLGALDQKLREEMQIELKQLQRDVGITFVFVTHDQQEALTMSDRIAVFNLGRIEQVGTPTDIYERPATEFVAGFVGTSNVFDPAQSHALLGLSGRFMVRPERVRLVGSNGAATGECNLAGTVRAVQFLGADTRLRVVLDAGGELVVTQPNTGAQDAHALQGARVNVAFHRDHAVQIPEAEISQRIAT